MPSSTVGWKWRGQAALRIRSLRQRQPYDDPPGHGARRGDTSSSSAWPWSAQRHGR